MIKFTIDFLTHSQDAVNYKWLFDAIAPEFAKPFKFDRKRFFELSNINPSEKYFYFNEISAASMGYLAKQVGNDILLGFEFSSQTKRLLEKLDITYINFWHHPVKFLDDLPLAFESNCPKIRENLKKFSISEDKLKFYAKYLKNKIKNSKDFRKIEIPANSLLLVGQSENDQSLMKSGKMLSFNDFQEQIDNFQGNIIYAPHPQNLNKKRTKIHIKNKPNLVKFLDKNKERLTISFESTYLLMASDNIKEVWAISSSIIREAKLFGKDAKYLYQPLFDDSICIMTDFLYPHFWNKIFDLQEIEEVKFDDIKNRLRLITRDCNLFWGMSEIDEVGIALSNFSKIKKSLLNKIFRIL